MDNIGGPVPVGGNFPLEVIWLIDFVDGEYKQWMGNTSNPTPFCKTKRMLKLIEFNNKTHILKLWIGWHLLETGQVKDLEQASKVKNPMQFPTFVMFVSSEVNYFQVLGVVKVRGVDPYTVS